MMGVLGTAPGLKGEVPSIAPTIAGGNIDVRYLQAGATLYLPVFNEGALLSGGDGHGLQGEGEVSGAAIEAPMTSTLRVEVLRGQALAAPVLDMSTRNYPETEYRNFLGIRITSYNVCYTKLLRVGRYGDDRAVLSVAHFLMERFGQR